MNYIPVLILLSVGLTIGLVVLLLTSFLGRSQWNKRKGIPFECGVPALGDARHRFSVRFYVVAILFLLFDIEGVFFFPWAIVYRKFLKINHFILLEMLFFVAVLLVGYFYVLRRKALEWE